MVETCNLGLSLPDWWKHFTIDSSFGWLTSFCSHDGAIILGKKRPAVCLSVHLSHFETRDIFEFCITLNGFAVMRPELLEFFFFLTHVYISINIKMACCRIVSIDENRRVELQHENSDKCLKAKVAYQQLKPV